MVSAILAGECAAFLGLPIFHFQNWVTVFRRSANPSAFRLLTWTRGCWEVTGVGREVTESQGGGWALVGQGLDNKAVSALLHLPRDWDSKGLTGGRRCTGKKGGGQRKAEALAGLCPLGTPWAGGSFLQTCSPRDLPPGPNAPAKEWRPGHP